MKLNAKVIEKTTKDGRKFKVLAVEIFKDVWKEEFLNDAELKLLEIIINANDKR